MKARKVSQNLIALSIAGVLSAAPAFAQNTNEGGGTTQGTQTTESDDSSNWGWIGLIGLAGLLGLRRRPEMQRDDARGRLAS